MFWEIFLTLSVSCSILFFLFQKLNCLTFKNSFVTDSVPQEEEVDSDMEICMQNIHCRVFSGSTPVEEKRREGKSKMGQGQKLSCDVVTKKTLPSKGIRHLYAPLTSS